MDIKTYQRMKAEADDLQRDCDRAEGALSAKTAQLKREYDCPTVTDAEKLKAKLAKEVERLEVRFDKELKAFETAWKGKLEE